MRLCVRQPRPLCEALGHHLIGRLAVECALSPCVVGGVEAAQQLLELAVRVDGDAQHLGTDAAVEALDHAVGLRRAGPDVAVLRAEFGAGASESGVRQLPSSVST